MTLIKKIVTLSLRIFLIATLIAQSFTPLVNNIAYAAGSVDLLIAITGPLTANNGDNFTYTINIRNDGPNAGDGSQFVSQLATGITNLSVACTLTGNGATCPTLLIGTDTITGDISTLPNNGVIEITITGRFPIVPPTSISHIATITVPIGDTDPMPSNNLSQINTTMTKLPADVAAVVSGSNSPWVYGSPVTYEIIHTNYGSGLANGGIARFAISTNTFPTSEFITITGYTINCVASGGAVCPTTFTTGATVVGGGGLGTFLYSESVDTRPSGGSLDITVSFIPLNSDYTPPVCVAGGGVHTGSMNLKGTSIKPSGITDPISSNNTDTISPITLPSVTIPACPEVDLATTISGSSSPWIYGSPVTYEITHTNYGPNAASGGRISADGTSSHIGFGGGSTITITGYTINCVASGGAVCPTTFTTGVMSLGGFSPSFYSESVDTRPSGGSLDITVSFIPLNSDYTPPVCQAGGGTRSEFVGIAGSSIRPSGFIDPVNLNNTVLYSASLPPVTIPACPEADLEATIVSGSSNNWIYGIPVTYEIIHTNHGPDNASGGHINGQASTSLFVGGSTITITGYTINCVASGGAVCPTTFTTGVMSLGGFSPSFYSESVDTRPSGGSLDITVSFIPLNSDYTPPVCQAGGGIHTENINIRGSSIRPTGTIDTNNSNNTDTTGAILPSTIIPACVDLTALIDVSPIYVYVNTPMQIVMNYRSGLGTASGSFITGMLSSGFIYDSRSCSSSGSAICGSIVYDNSTHTFTGTVPYLPNGGQISYYFSGWATSYPSTWRTETTISTSSESYDSNTTTNFSQLNFSVIEDNPIILKNSIDKTVTPGGQVRYMLDVINPISGLNLATGMLTDTLPTGFTYNSTISIGLSGTATRIPLIDPVMGTSSPTRGEFYLYAGDSIHVEFLVDVASLLPNGTGIYQNSSFFTYSTEFSGYNSIHYDGDLTGVINDDVFVDIPSPAIIDANNDSALFTGGTTGIVNILTNDTLSGGQATVGNVVVSFSGSTIFTGLVYDNTGGQVVVGPTALTGIYTIPYQICEIVNPSNCDTATVIITIIEPPIIPIIATDDNALFTGGIGGIINILINDTLSGNQATTGNVTVLFTGVGPSFSFTGAQYFTGLIYDNTGGQVVVGPTALTGIYIIPYYICELNYDSHGIQLTNLKNCDPATIIITIVSPLIVVPPIVPPIVIPPSGGGGGGYSGCGTGCYIPPQPETIHPAPPIKKQVKLTPVIEDIPLIPKTGPAKIINGLQEIGKNVYNTLFISPTSVNHIPKNMDQWIQDRLGDHTQKSIGYFIVPKYSIIIPLLKQEVDGGYVITKESYYMIQMMLMAISEDDTVWLYNWEDSDKTFVLKEYNYDSEVKEKLSLSYKDYTTTLGIRR